MTKESTKFPWDQLVLWLTACPLLALSVIVLIGWITRDPYLIQINFSFSPMQPNTAFCFLFSSLAVFFVLFSKRLLTIVASSFVLILSGLTLVEYLFQVDIGIDQLIFSYDLPFVMTFPGRMASNTALCFFLSNISLILAVFSYRTLFNFLIEALSGIVAAISSVSLFGYVTGLISPIGLPDFIRMAIHTAAGMLLLSLGVFYHQWILSFRKDQFSYGTLLGTFFFAIGMTIALWQSFNIQQYNTMQKLAQNNVNYIAYDVQSTLENIVTALERLSVRWGVTGDIYKENNKTLWESIAITYVKDLDGLESINWYNDALQLQESVGSPSRFAEHLNEPSTKTLMESIKSQKFSGKVAHLTGKQTLFLLLPLISSNQHFMGILVAEIDLLLLIDKSVPPFLSNYYEIQILDANGTLYDRKTTRSAKIGQGAIAEIHSTFIDWSIKVFPTQASLNLIQTILPSIILISGIIITIFMVMVVFLSQVALRSKKNTLAALEERATALAYREAILDSSNYSVISTDTKGLILSFNKAAEKLLLYNADDVIGKLTPTVFHDQTELEARTKELSIQLKQTLSPGFDIFIAMATRGITDNRDWIYVRKDGSHLPVKLSVTAVKNSQKEIIGFVGIIYDLTEAKALELMKNELISITAHELKSPLISIKESLDFLIHLPYSSEAKSTIDIAYNHCKQLIRLSSDLLDIQKLEAENIEFHFKEFSATTLLKKAIETSRDLAKTHHVLLKDIDNIPECSIYGDEDRLIQAITHFISNAIKHSPKEGIVSFVISQNYDKIRIGVKDQGSGISKQFHHLLFKKFSQIPSSDPSRSKEGVGLGLHIAKLIIEKHRGRVGFDTSPQGSLFWFELPILIVRE